MTVARLAVLGSPIAHSRSPDLHRAAYRELGLDWSYEAVEVGRGELDAYVRSRNEQWRGLSLTMPLKVEVLTKISGVSFDEALQGSKTFELDGYQIPYIGKAALIANKKSAGRHKDLADVEELERVKET